LAAHICAGGVPKLPGCIGRNSRANRGRALMTKGM
jgi:hypothetical protein